MPVQRDEMIAINYVFIHRMPYTIALLPTGERIRGEKLYVHENYSKSTHDFDIAILVLDETLNLYPPYIYPAILPQAPLAFHHGNQLHVAMTNGSKSHFERVNASIWSNDECAPNDEHLMCIEIDSDCDDLVRKRKIKQKSKPLNNITSYCSILGAAKHIFTHILCS